MRMPATLALQVGITDPAEWVPVMGALEQLSYFSDDEAQLCVETDLALAHLDDGDVACLLRFRTRQCAGRKPKPDCSGSQHIDALIAMELALEKALPAELSMRFFLGAHRAAPRFPHLQPHRNSPTDDGPGAARMTESTANAGIAAWREALRARRLRTMQTSHSDDGEALLCMHSLQRGLLGEPCTFPGLVLHSNLSELLPGFPERRPALAL